MRILVIDDNATHRNAAVAQLGNEHEVVTASGADEALNLMGCSYDFGKDRTHQHSFDVVLCDLLMPPLRRACSRSCSVDEIDAGIYLAITAARNGAKYVGLLTDSNHHEHPAADCLDSVQRDECVPDIFQIDGALVCMTNDRNLIQHFFPDNLARPLEFKEYDKCREKTVYAKNWRELLDYILKEAAKRPATTESVAAFLTEHKALKRQLAEAQRENETLRLKAGKLESQTAQDNKKLQSLQVAVQQVEYASSRGWWQRRHLLPEKIKSLISSARQ